MGWPGWGGGKIHSLVGWDFIFHHFEGALGSQATKWRIPNQKVDAFGGRCWIEMK